MEISVISQKLLLPPLIFPYCLAPCLCCQGGLLYHASASTGPSVAPRCVQPLWNYWSSADVSISSRHCRALSQPVTITQSLFFLFSPSSASHLSCTNPPLEQTLTDLSDDGFIGSHGSPQTHTDPLIPLTNLRLKKNFYLPPAPTVDIFTYCYPSAFALSASSWFVLLPATSKENQGSQSHRQRI